MASLMVFHCSLVFCCWCEEGRVVPAMILVAAVEDGGKMEVLRCPECPAT